MDTESGMAVRPYRPVLRFNNIDPEVDTERTGCSPDRSRVGGFNNIDPEVDTESPGAPGAAGLSGRFQQYRSRSGY